MTETAESNDYQRKILPQTQGANQKRLEIESVKQVDKSTLSK